MDRQLSIPVDLPSHACLVCGIALEEAKTQDEGYYVPSPPVRHSPKLLGVRGYTCAPHAAIVKEDPTIEVSVRPGLFEIKLMAAIEKENPEAHRVCIDVKNKSHAEVEDQRPSVKARMDRAELKIRGQNELHTWRQATWAWHVRAYGLDGGWSVPWGWIREDYRFPEVTRPVERRYVDMDRLPRRADGGPASMLDPDDKGFEEWGMRHGIFNWRTIEPARLV